MFELFEGFLGLGMMGFGGVLPLAMHMMVNQRHWMTEEEFTEVVGLCQFLPGGNIINVSVAAGLKFHGVKGAFVALMGLITVPTAVVVLLGMIYDRYRDNPMVGHLFAGMSCAAAGLLVAMAVKMAMQLRRRRMAIVIACVCFVAIAILRTPLLPTMLLLTPISVWLIKRFPS
jgi:chromate transporter